MLMFFNNQKIYLLKCYGKFLHIILELYSASYELYQFVKQI